MKPKIPFKSIKTGLQAGTKTLLQQALPGGRVLAIEIAGSQIIGAVAEARGKKVSVQNFVAIDRTSAKDDLPDTANIEEIMDRLDYHGGPAVLVTPLARSMQITMNRAKVDKLRHYQLLDALRWEVEPFTGITGTQAMIGAEKGSPVEQEDLLLLAEEDEELDVNVSAIEQNIFRAMKQIFKRSGLKLVRLYPPEVCFFMPLFLEPVEGARAVFDIGADYANFTIVKGKHPKQINTYPLGKDVLQEIIDGDDTGEAAKSLDFLMRQIPGPLPLVLTGIGATMPNIKTYLDSRCDYGATSLELSRSDKLGRADHEGMNAMYAVAAGAAVRELSGRAWRRIGITDGVPVMVRLKQSAYLVPLGATILLALGLFGHYQVMKNSKERYKARTVELNAEVKKKKQKHASYTSLEAELRNVNKKIQTTKKQIAFLHGGSDDNLNHIDRVLDSLLGMPLEMLLDSISQEGEHFILKGKARDFEVVGSFAVDLQQHPWCSVVDIKVLEHTNEGRLHFLIAMHTNFEADDSTRIQ